MYRFALNKCPIWIGAAPVSPWLEGGRVGVADPSVNL